MNVIQAKTSFQTNTQPESGRQDPAAMVNREFEGHLNSATQHVDWFTDEKVGNEKKRIYKEQIEKRKHKDEKEDEMIEEITFSALKNEVRIENDVQEMSHLWELGSENKVKNIQGENNVRKEKVKGDHITKNTNTEIGQKKVDQKNPHFVQPAKDSESGSETQKSSFSDMLSSQKTTPQQTSPSTLSGLSLSEETVGADQQKKLDVTNRINSTQNSTSKDSDSTGIQGLKAKGDQSSIQNQSAYQKQTKTSDFSQIGKAGEKTQTNKGMGFSNEIQRAIGKENQGIEKNTKTEDSDFSKAEK
ncbi:hypothetical protein KKA14_17485, partial [bacterium]|nr:hypothetical protein [bacterium]